MFAETLKYISKSNNSLKEKNDASFSNFIFWGFFPLLFNCLKGHYKRYLWFFKGICLTMSMQNLRRHTEHYLTAFLPQIGKKNKIIYSEIP